MKRRIAALVLPLAATAAPAQDEPAPQQVEIVGSRLPRVDAETALPVQVIRRDEIERSGLTNAEELLERVSANFGGHPQALGLGNAATPGFSGASLRGMGAGETLVLLNGRRLANYAFTSVTGPGVDLHAIPLAPIERVEVLRDGASALYGTDAIAGVINFVTRADFAGVQGSLALRRPQAGGAERARITVASGLGEQARDGINVFGLLDVQRTEALAATERAFASTSYRPELGLDGTSPPSWPANVVLPIPRGRVFVNPAAPACTAATVNKGNACWFDYAKTLGLVAPSTQANAFGRATLALDAQTELHAEVSLARNDVRFASSPTPVLGARFVLPESSAYYPASLGVQGDLVLGYRALTIGPRTSDVRSHNARLLAGWRARVGEWDVDGAVTINDSLARETYVDGYLDSTLLAQAFATGLVNPFGPSGQDGEALLAASEIYGLARKARGRTHSADVRATGSIGALAVAAGVEARHEQLRDEPMPIVATVGGAVPPGPKEGQRNVVATYAELVAPLARGLEAQVAARWDRYSDFGTAFNPKVSMRLQPAPAWVFRASAGRGFRAPSMPELHTQQVLEGLDIGLFGYTDPARCPTTGLPSDCLPAVPALFGGNPALQPQRSTQTSIGLVVEPDRHWQASLDLWSIRVNDVIGELPLEEVVRNLALYEGRNVVRAPADPAFPQLPGPITLIRLINENLGERRIRGADLSVSLRAPLLPLGRLAVQLDGTYVRHARQHLFPGNAVELLGRASPRWQHVLTFALDRGALSATLSQRWRHGYRDESPLPDGSVRHVAPYRVWDAQVGITPMRGLRLTLGLRNLLDDDPPFTNQARHFQVGYDPLYADPFGRTWTVGLHWQAD